MKIYPNPNFPRYRPSASAPHKLPLPRKSFNTLTFVTELQARNSRALEHLRSLPRRRGE